MKNNTLCLNFLVFIFCSSFLFSCNKVDCNDEDGFMKGVNNIGISSAMIKARSSNEGSINGNDTLNEYFKEGDQISIFGASDKKITFIYTNTSNSIDNKKLVWRTDRDYKWIDNPEIVRACIGNSSTVIDGKSIPDILVAEYDCNGTIPKNGLLSFLNEHEFKHTSALLRVNINNWTGYFAPTVTLKNIHKIVLVNENGTYEKNEKSIFNIVLNKVSDSREPNDSIYNPDGKWNLVYEALVPGATIKDGKVVDSNILSDIYSLMVSDLSVFTYEPDETKIPTYYLPNSVNTFTLNYIDSSRANGNVKYNFKINE